MEEPVSLSEKLHEAISLAITGGTQLDKQAFDFLHDLLQTEDPVELMEETLKKIETLPQRPLFISRNILEEVMKGLRSKKIDTITEAKREAKPDFHASSALPFHAWAQDVDADITVIEDPTEKIGETGTLEVYREYFQDRFRKIRKILLQRRDTRDAMPISEALKTSKNSKIKVIAMIAEKREHKQKIFLTIEDLEASATVLVPQNADHHVMERSQALLLDQVVCVNAIKGRGDLLIAENFILPDMPQRTPNRASMPVFAALTSDLHVGSKAFMHKEFKRFLLWLKGEFGTREMREIASHIKYVVIAGDLVDGIGIYPGQVRELEIRDIYRQYRAMASLIEQIPEYIELIIIPGNHDATRKAMPQPAVTSEYIESLCGTRKLYSIGNPSIVTLHNVEVLLYHGRSLDDLTATVPNINFQTPDKAMKVLLQARHLTPIYGQKTAIAPEKRDFMVIERPPDIFHAGHVHVLKYDVYRGTLIVNSGAWQGQTNFQKKMGLQPTPGIVPVVDLQTLRLTPFDFATPVV